MDRRQRLEAYFSEFEPGVSPPLWVELTFGYGPTLYCEDLVELLRKDQMPAMTIQYLIDGGSGRVRKVDTQSWTLAFRERDEDKIKDKLGKFMDEMARDDWLLEFPDVAFPNDTLQSEILTAVLHYGRSSMKVSIRCTVPRVCRLGTPLADGDLSLPFRNRYGTWQRDISSSPTPLLEP